MRKLLLFFVALSSILLVSCGSGVKDERDAFVGQYLLDIKGNMTFYYPNGSSEVMDASQSNQNFYVEKISTSMDEVVTDGWLGTIKGKVVGKSLIMEQTTFNSTSDSGVKMVLTISPSVATLNGNKLTFTISQTVVYSQSGSTINGSGTMNCTATKL